MSHKVTVENVATYHQVAKIFNMPAFSKATFRCIERFFDTVAKNHNFLHLDLACVSQILSSLKLNVTSELEVLRAADRWLSFKAALRRAFATDLLVKVRLPLLSNRELDKFLNDSFAFRKCEKCTSLIDDVSKRKNRDKVTEPRHCEDFDLVVVGGSDLDIEHPVQRVDGRSGSGTKCAHMELSEQRKFFAAACLDGCVYVFGGSESDAQSVQVKKLPLGGREWLDLPDLDLVADQFGLCSFAGGIYVIGGWRTAPDKWGQRSESRCVRFDAERHGWAEVGSLRESRAEAGSAVFRGKLVACGGMQQDWGVQSLMNLPTVEAYDRAKDKWAFMPRMNERRHGCKLAAIRNKLFVFGGGPTTCELFDSVCNRFVFVQPPPEHLEIDLGQCAFAASVGASRLVVYLNGCRKTAVYDAEARDWSVESCDVTAVSCLRHAVVKVPAPFSGGKIL